MTVTGEHDAGAAAAFNAQRYVRRLLLRHVPPRNKAATIVTIAARAEMEIHAVRDHLACMSAGVGTLVRHGRMYYYRRTEEGMAHDHDSTPLPERIAALLGAALADPDPITRLRDGMTAVQIGRALSVRPNTVSKALKVMMSDGRVERTGAGKRGDPHMYHHGGYEAPAAADPLPAALDAEAAENEATTSPLTPELPAADTEIPAEPEDSRISDFDDATIDTLKRIAKAYGEAAGNVVEAWAAVAANRDAAEVAHCYAIVIDDLTARASARATDAHGSLEDAKVLTAAATLLMRILEGEADR